MGRGLGAAATAALIGLAALAATSAAEPAKPAGKEVLPVRVWDIPSVERLPDDERGRLARYGRSIFEATYAHVGPEVADPAKRFAGNNLACKNCHLNGGFKKFGLPVIGAAADYPAYSARSGAPASLVERLNGCMTRSMNGRPMPAGLTEMRALVSYLDILSTGIRADAEVIGKGAGRMPELARAADPARGRAIYADKCALCHRSGGEGLRRGLPGDALGYLVPPLWGPDSFNDGAGMNRLITAANFVHANMPNGTDWTAPVLGVEDAWDVAAYVVSQPRPHKADLAADFPDKLAKPIDTPYGPYADGFSEQQHKYGPFGPIAAKVKALDAARK
ncbi:c-type cytochrome [Chelatococcus reniformis]|uniref:Cytochrome c domain-containing protein n=1 Tax=Chelatococcus reniformis TaxID=1494448 RepID=A0A916UBX6_9HYPH|nr:c-type cytochrome [Chelatococcus reniformis]GGC66195.1 hypothetical protein GCM10010994_25990 [Chelatococcus reniformis]